MFSSQVIVKTDNREIKLPKDFRIVPQWYQSTSYIPSYTVEGEEYGGYNDYDEEIIYEDEMDKIDEYLKNEYNIDPESDNNTEFVENIYYEAESYIANYGLSLDIFKNSEGFEFFISELIDEYKLSDESIEILLHNKEFIDMYLEHNHNDAILIKDENKEKLSNCKMIIDLSKTDHIFIGFDFSDSLF